MKFIVGYVRRHFMNDQSSAKGAIYLINENGDLVEMRTESYASEDLLQGLLADYPDLLAGEQINSQAPRNWILISREMAVPDSEGGGARWSLDHLLIDQDGIPTLVEVKRSSDTRIRREVVGQMLDYAANAVSYWTVEELRARFEASCQEPGIELEKFLGEGSDVEEFWATVDTNLKIGKLRMLFVADEIPMELRRIIEFLNEQMDPAEVLGVEVKQYTGGGLKTLVPRVVGQTAEVEHKKSSRSRKTREWDYESFIDELRKNRGDDIVQCAQKIIDWARDRELEFSYGTGAIHGTIFPWFHHAGANHSFLAIDTSGCLGIYFDMLGASHRSNFSIEQRRELRSRLNEVKNFDIPERLIESRTHPSLTHLLDRDEMAKFLDALDWVVGEIRCGQSHHQR